uniref:Uncharacterized protein n=1 Tax=Glossina austeni TaxID=7395 RepID=A0A1A9UDA6_GLOAU
MITPLLHWHRLNTVLPLYPFSFQHPYSSINDIIALGMLGVNRPYISTINPLGIAAAKHANNSTVTAPVNATIPERSAVRSSSLLNATAGDNSLSVEIVCVLELNCTGLRGRLQLIERVEDLSEAYGTNRNILRVTMLYESNLKSGKIRKMGSGLKVDEKWKKDFTGLYAKFALKSVNRNLKTRRSFNKSWGKDSTVLLQLA